MSRTTQSGWRVCNESRKSAPDGKDSASKLAIQSKRRRVVRMPWSSSTTAMGRRVLLIWLDSSSCGGGWLPLHLRVQGCHVLVRRRRRLWRDRRVEGRGPSVEKLKT